MLADKGQSLMKVRDSLFSTMYQCQSLYAESLFLYASFLIYSFMRNFLHWSSSSFR